MSSEQAQIPAAEQAGDVVDAPAAADNASETTDSTKTTPASDVTDAPAKEQSEAAPEAAENAE